MRRSICLFPVLLLLGGCMPGAVRPEPAPPPVVGLERADTLDPRPPWNYEGLRAGALYALAPLLGYAGRDRPPAGTIRDLRVLAWHVTEDTATALTIERALLWLQLSGEPPLWALANLYRHPRTDTLWRPVTVTHAQYFGARLLSTPPSNADIYALLDILQNWRFEEDPAAPFVAADVRERTWQALVGEQPTRQHGPPDPPPPVPADDGDPPDDDDDPSEDEDEPPPLSRAREPGTGQR